MSDYGYKIPALNDGEVFRNEIVIKKSRFILPAPFRNISLLLFYFIWRFFQDRLIKKESAH